MAASALAQVNTNSLPTIPPPALTTPAPAVPVTEQKMATDTAKTNAPAKKLTVKAKKKAVKKKTAKAGGKKAAPKPAAKTSAIAPAAASPLVVGPAIVTADHVNLRGQAGLKGEVVGHAKKGDTITVLSAINLDKHAAEEPAQWAKITLPASAKVWVNAKFVDATNKVVTAKKLNLRGGPGENFSVLGVLEKGAAVNQITNKGGWLQIETPANAFAFVAANYLKQEAAVPTVTEPVKPVEPTNPAPVVEPVPVTPTMPVATNTVTEPAAIVPVPTTPPAPPEPTLTAPVASNAPPVVTTPAPAPVPASEIVDTNPPPPRIVTHEGYVRTSVSPVAPTYYELYDLTTGNAINYLYTSTTNLNIGRYKGYQIVVTGEEGLEARWKDTPVLTIQKIYVLSTNQTTSASTPAGK